MNNLLSQVENNLRHIVKKHKNISFSIGLTLVYLMVGLSVFSEENIIKFENKIASKEKINKSIINLKEELYRIKIENNKKIKMSNFELQELMKQGDQVIKSPWASWQFGINFMYNNWDGSYKGKGDKKKEPIIYQREKNKFKKIEIKNYSYGTTTIRNIEEPFSIIPIEPSIRLRGIDKKNVEIILPSIKKIEKFTKNIQTDTAEVIRPVISDSPEINIQIPVPNSKPFIDYAAQAERYNSDKYREFLKPLLYSWTGFQPDIEKNGEEFLVKETGKYVTSSEDVFIANPTVKSNGFRNPRGTHRYFYVKMDAIGTDKEVIEGIIVPTVEGGHEKNGNIENFKFFIAGNIENTGKISASKSGVTVATDGVIGFHVVTNSMFKNIDVFLKGRAAFISAESWQTPKIAFDNINVRIDRQENTLFYWYPGKYYKMFVDSSSNSKNRRGTLIGNINADFISKGNTVYSIVGLVGANNILSEGKYKLEGSNNIVFSNLGYNPNFQNFIGKNGINDKYKTGMTPIVNLKTPVESYGDDNVIMYFSDLIPDGTVDYPKTDRWDNIMHDEKWEKTKIGIYQGEVGIAANIGEKLAIDENLTQQTDEGKVYDNNYVENNVGILAQSGQRKGIIPSKDLGAEKYYGDGSFKPLNFANGEYEDLGNGRQYKEIKTDKIYNYRIMDHSFADADKIHALYVNDINVTFGKYSKNGIAIVADRGTQIDVAIAGNYATKDGDKSRIKIRTTPIIDYNMNSLSYTNDNKLISSYNEVNNEAATGTVYALAKGKWKDSLTRMDSKESIDPSSPHGLSYRKGMSEETINSLKDLGSEINIGQDLEISAKYKKNDNREYYPIAYAALSGAVINAEKTTKAYGFGSIIAYAENTSRITAKGKIEATDEWADKDDEETRKYLYKNIGGYAKGEGSTVSLGTNQSGVITETISTVNGIAAIAENKAEVNINGKMNIDAGINGALIAIDEGIVNYNGGNIIIGREEGNIYKVGNYSKTTPFFAGKTLSTNVDGKIKIHGETTLELYDGILINGKATDYSKEIVSTSEKYQGMKNITVNLKKDGVNIGIYDSLNEVEWKDNETYLDSLNKLSKIKKIHDNNYKYKSTLINGKLKISSNVNLNDSNNNFNNISLENELITIGENVEISSLNKGLVLGSNKSGAEATSGYINKGKVIIESTSLDLAALNVNYGLIRNEKEVNINKGSALYGVNGSKLENSAEGKIKISEAGFGMVGIGTDENSKKNYGTDILTNISLINRRTIEINNEGFIDADVKDGVAIFAENNTGAPKENVLIKTKNLLKAGENGIGIALIGKEPTTVNHDSASLKRGGVINASSRNSSGENESDIIVGIKGKGIYAEDSDIVLNGSYIIETKENGVGIQAVGLTKISGDLEYKYSGNNLNSGIGIVYNNALENEANIKINNFTSTKGGLTALYSSSESGLFKNYGNISGNSKVSEFALISEGADIENNGKITLGNSENIRKANIGVYSRKTNKIFNNSEINVGDNSIAIYGYEVKNNGKIKVGNAGVGIYLDEHNSLAVKNTVLDTKSEIEVRGNEAVAVFVAGNNKRIEAKLNSKIKISDTSFAYVNKGNNNEIISNTKELMNLGNDSIFIYSDGNNAKFINHTPLMSSGDRNYGIYVNGEVNNYADIDFGQGVGNIAMYSTGGIATNQNGAVIKVGKSDNLKQEYAVGMATGYFDITTQKISNEGIIINNGEIRVEEESSIAMYAVGKNSKVINKGNINLIASNSIGMYIDKGAVGENYGNIQTTPDTKGTGISGVVVKNGGIIKNYGTIKILGKENVGVQAGNEKFYQEEGVNSSTIAYNFNTGTDEKIIRDIDGKELITIQTPPKADPSKVFNNLNKSLPIVKIDTDIASPKPQEILINSLEGLRKIDISRTNYGTIPSSTEVNALGMYIDTSGINYTKPIEGIKHLIGLKNLNMIFGVEAARYTNSKIINIGPNILSPYNEELKSLSSKQINLNTISGSLTWYAHPMKSATTGFLESVYLLKVPYTVFRIDNDKNTYNFLDGLEQRYGIEDIGSKEKNLFDKLNSLKKSEAYIFAQAIDEMMGHQYANIQQRIHSTGRILDKEFDYLKDEWRTASKDSNKIKVFGMKGEYSTDTAGVIDYKNNAYGVAYVGENETIKLGKSSGWYTGLVHNKFNFKDIGNSKEEMLQAKLGLFNTTAFDDNGSLNWTISGEAFAGYNKMHRRFLVVDEIFNARSRYWSYGLALKNELSKTFRLSEDFSLRGYASLKAEYGRFQKIKEKSGEVRLEIKSNDYISVKPEIGGELIYKTPLSGRNFFNAKLGVKYDNELGRVGDAKNKARVAHTTADWFNIRGEKEDRKGNVGADLSLGWDNEAYGITANIGYDTKGKNRRAGLGLRVIF